MGMAANAEAYGLASVPAPETLFTDRFLPPHAERMPVIWRKHWRSRA